MGMSVGAGAKGGGRRRRGVPRYGAMADINMTPFIDVMLVLLIIFMVSIPAAKRVILGVPPEAVRTVHGIDYVTVDAADGSLDVAVVLGERYQDAGRPRVEVLTGLADGDRIVVP